MGWNKLKETLNPEFDWELAVQATLRTDDSLEDVCYIFTYYLVTQLLACLFNYLFVIYHWIYENGVNEKFVLLHQVSYISCFNDSHKRPENHFK